MVTVLQIILYLIHKTLHFLKNSLKNHHLIEPYLDQYVIQQLINISAGWYLIEQTEDKLIFWDLRFGQVGLDLNTAPFLWSYDLTYR